MPPQPLRQLSRTVGSGALGDTDEEVLARFTDITAVNRARSGDLAQLGKPLSEAPLRSPTLLRRGSRRRGG